VGIRLSFEDPKSNLHKKKKSNRVKTHSRTRNTRVKLKYRVTNYKKPSRESSFIELSGRSTKGTANQEGNGAYNKERLREK